MAQTGTSVEQRTTALPSADGLFVFFDGLRREGYRIDARQIAAAQCLLAEARAGGADSPAARRIKYRLAPLIAKSPSQQQDFYRRYDALCGAPVVLVRIGPERISGPATEALKRDRRGWAIAGAVAAFLTLAAAVALYFWPQPPPQPAEVTTAASPTLAQPELPQERIEIAQKVLFPFYAALKPALAAAPLLAFVAWLVMRWRRRLLLISRGVVLGDAELAGVRLPLKLSEVLFTGPELRASAHDLRKHRFLPTHKLDSWQTVDATARQAGLFTPVYQKRPQLPEYVFLIEQNSTNDHLARLFDLAVARLRDEHVEIQRYYFHTDPRQLQADDHERSTVPLAELAARTDDHRLFVIATADGFFHPLTGEVESWVQRLKPWRSRTMLSTRPLEQWTTAELRLLEEGFSLATAEASGFAATGAKVAVGDDTAELLEGVLFTPPRARSSPGTKNSIGYTTARIALLGDTGVGKTTLGWRIAYANFRPHASTHGQQFWVIDQLSSVRQDGTQCEAVLWDLTGGPDYRLINALFLDQVDLGLLVFDPAERERPLAGVEYWVRHLRAATLHNLPGRSAGEPLRGAPALLVGARSDRTMSTLSREEEIEDFCRRQGIEAYILTSAYENTGVADLIGRIKASIPWDRLTATTTRTFKRVKEHVLKLKESPNPPAVLVEAAELRRQLEVSGPAWRFTDAEMMTAIGNLAKHGYVMQIQRASGEVVILLAPDRLVNLAASIILETRQHRGPGLLDEARLLAGDYRFPELDGLSKSEWTAMLDAAIGLFLQHNLCFRQTIQNRTVLIFPSLINEKRPI